MEVKWQSDTPKMVKWQSDAPKMELKVPSEIKIDGGGYPPYELPVATKEVLGGVKVDGDTINITSDGVISTQKVSDSVKYTPQTLTDEQKKQARENIGAVDTANGLLPVECVLPLGLNTTNKTVFVKNGVMLPLDYSTATGDMKTAILRFSLLLNSSNMTPAIIDATVESFATLIKNGIFGDDFYSSYTYPSNVLYIYDSPFSPQTVICMWSYYSASDSRKGFALRADKANGNTFTRAYNITASEYANNYISYTSIPLAAYASDSGDTPSIQQVEMAAAPTSDMQIATKKYVDDHAGGGGGSSGSSIPVYSFTSGQELTDEEKGQLDIIKNNPKSVIVYIDGLKANNINFVSNTIAFSVGGDATITAGTGTTGSYRYYEPQHGGLYLYSYQLSRIYDTISDSYIIVDDTMITRVRSADFPVVTNIDDLGKYSDLDINFITNWIHNPNQYNVTVSNKPVVYVYNNRNSTSVEAYTLSASYAGLALGGTTLYFSDNKKLAFDSNKTRYYSLGEKVLLDSQNWQNYISLGGQGSWTYTNSTDDGSLYNATELIIMWLYNNEYYCNYYKFDQDSGSTLGGNYQGYTFNAYGQVSGQFNSYWSYNGSAINTSNMDIQSIYYKT